MRKKNIVYVASYRINIPGKSLNYEINLEEFIILVHSV